MKYVDAEARDKYEKLYNAVTSRGTLTSEQYKRLIGWLLDDYTDAIKNESQAFIAQIKEFTK